MLVAGVAPVSATAVSVPSTAWSALWVGGESGDFGEPWKDGSSGSSNWVKTGKTANPETLTSDGYAPSTGDPTFIGYTYTPGLFTINDDVITVNNAGVVSEKIYLGNNVTFNMISSEVNNSTVHLGTNTQYNLCRSGGHILKGITFVFDSFSLENTAQVTLVTDTWKQPGTAYFEGAYTLCEAEFSYTLLSVGDAATLYNINSGTWSAENFKLTDSDGNTLSYQGCVESIDALSEGQSGLVVNEQGATLVAKNFAPVPEPATASLSLLGLAALMMRRRRA